MNKEVERISVELAHSILMSDEYKEYKRCEKILKKDVAEKTLFVVSFQHI